MKLTVELRPHIGIGYSPAIGEHEVRHNQQLVYVGSNEIKRNYGVSPIQCGIVSDDGDGGVAFLSHAKGWGQAAFDEIQKRVDELTGRSGTFHVPPTIHAPPPTVDLDDEE